VLSAGHGSKGLREYRWAWTELTRLGNAPNQHALLVREAMTTNTRGEYDRAYYLVFAPARTTLAAVAQVAGARWTIEQGFEAAKQEVGLDEYEVRKYDGLLIFITGLNDRAQRYCQYKVSPVFPVHLLTLPGSGVLGFV